MKNIKDYDLEDLKQELISIGEKGFRAEQIFKWLYQEKVKSFNEQDIVNILSIIEGHYYDRGTLGQTADILISNIQDSANKMFNIILNHKIDTDIRYDAEILLAHQSKEFYIRNKELIKNMKSEYTELIVQYIEKFGEFDLY